MGYKNLHSTDVQVRLETYTSLNGPNFHWPMPSMNVLAEDSLQKPWLQKIHLRRSNCKEMKN